MQNSKFVLFFTIVILSALGNTALAQSGAASIPAEHTLKVDQLAAILTSAKGERPLVFQVGSHVLYQQAHIPGSEYVGAASSDAGLSQLRKRVEKLAKGQWIVLYCGCCPWDHCPNVKPAYDALVAAGFNRLSVLYIANNFGADWVERQYPTAKGDQP